jgi:hypothetical protein
MTALARSDERAALRARLPGQPLLMALIVSPMIVPLVIVAVGVYFAYAPFGLTGSLVSLTLAHTALAVPFVVITVSALSGVSIPTRRGPGQLSSLRPRRAPADHSAADPAGRDLRRAVRLSRRSTRWWSPCS